MGNHIQNSGHTNYWYSPLLINTSTFWSVVEERLMDQYIQQWRQLLRESTGKLRQFKKEFELESYLQLPAHLRIPLTRLRVSAHQLRVETGRYTLPQALPPEQRVCWHCIDDIEDEVHFLLIRPLYSEERKVLLRECSRVNKAFSFLSQEDKFLFLLETHITSLQYTLAKFIKTAFETRRSMIANI